MISFQIRWRNAPIGVKFTLLMGVFVLIIFLLAVSSYVSLNMIQKNIATGILSSIEIRHLALQMETDMQRSRQLDRDFFLRWPEMGFKQAYATYAVKNMDNMDALIAGSRQLQTLLTTSEVSQELQRNIPNLNFYLSAADRYARTFDDAVALIAALGQEDSGLQPRLAQLSQKISKGLEQFASPFLSLLFSRAQTLEKEYLITRQRPYMQSTFNLLDELEAALLATLYHHQMNRDELLGLLKDYRIQAEAILLLDREIRSKLNEFDLQMAALEPISTQLVALADREVQQARQAIARTGQLAKGILAGGVVLALVLAGLVALLVRHSIAANLVALSHTAEELQQGNLAARAVISSNDEIGRLGLTLNAMAERIAELMVSLQARAAMARTRLFQAIESVNEGFLLYDADGRLVLFNQHSRLLLQELKDLVAVGVTVEQTLRAAVTREVFLNIPETHQVLPEKLLQLQRGAAEACQVQKRNGNWLKISTSATPNGETVCILEDITSSKRAEQEKLDLERKMLHSQKLESLGVLAGGVAHDFNNLLAAMLGNLELANLKLPETSDLRVYIDRIEKAVTQAAHLTRQMLDYSGKGRIHFARLNLNKLVRDNFQMLRTVISRNISVDFQLADNLPWIEADEGQIQQVLMNLITNASEAVGKQPGVITIATTVEACDQARLEHSRIETKPPPGLFVRLAVSDSGAGMDADTRERIFEPFFTTKFVGRGLGMSATLGIIRGHGGAIMLKSEPLQGTCFEVFFPACSASGPLPQSSGSPNTDAPSPTAATGLILVVDDEAPVREFLTEALQQLGYQTLSAGDGLEAVSLFRHKSDEIACIVLDLTMPIMGGVAAFNEFQRIKPGIKVILSSGFSTENVVTQFSHQKPQGFLQKPFQIDALKKEINRVLLQGDSSEEA